MYVDQHCYSTATAQLYLLSERSELSRPPSGRASDEVERGPRAFLKVYWFISPLRYKVSVSKPS